MALRRKTPRDRDVVDAISSMPDNYLLCREYGHNWAPNTVHRIKEGYDQVLRCTRCSTYRHRVLDHGGVVITNVYRYEDGYQIEGLGRLVGGDRAILRLTSVQRQLPEDER